MFLLICYLRKIKKYYYVVVLVVLFSSYPGKQITAHKTGISCVIHILQWGRITIMCECKQVSLKQSPIHCLHTVKNKLICQLLNSWHTQLLFDVYNKEQGTQNEFTI